MSVEQAFSRARENVEAIVTTPDAEKIVAQGRRRRSQRMVVAGLAVVAAIVGGYALVQPREARIPDPATSPTWTPPAGNRVEGKILPGFLVHEEKADEPQINPHVVDGPCLGRPVQSAGIPHSIGEGMNETRIVQELYVYADEAAAKQVMQTVRQRQVRGCMGFPDARVLKTDSPKWADETLGQTVALPADGAGEHTGEPVRMVVLRVGKAVATFSGYPEIPEIDQDAQAMAKRLCIFSSSGCVPPAGQPQQIRTLTNGGEVWAAALDAYPNGDAKARPGAAVAAAAEQGFNASLVPVECDQGAGEAWTVNGFHASYVAVYFKTREEAESLHPARGVFKVRTWCVS